MTPTLFKIHTHTHIYIHTYVHIYRTHEMEIQINVKRLSLSSGLIGNFDFSLSFFELFIVNTP